MAKKKKEPKVEKVFGNNEELKDEVAENEQSEEQSAASDIDELLGVEETPEDKLTEKQKLKLEKINNVKNKISKILKTSNVEIVDENFDDDYDYGSSENIDGHSQQDYDSLKALYGSKDKNKKQEVTLTIDDFDYMYVGQYLEEYDLMHMKNIKRVKIQRKRSPKLKKFLIISSVVLVAALGVVLGILMMRETPVYLKSVSLNQTERSYYIDQEFDFRGLYFIAEYSDGKTEKVKLDSSHFNSDLSTGKYERTGENLEDIVFVSNGSTKLVFTYNGFNVDYNVSVSNKTKNGLNAAYSEGIFNIASGGYINSDFLTLYLEYEDIGKEPVDLSQEFKLTVDGIQCDYSSLGYKVVGGTTKSSRIKITYLTYEITLDYNKCFV